MKRIAWALGVLVALPALANDAQTAVERIQASLDSAAAGDRVTITTGKYEGDLYVTQPDITVFGADGAEVHGTVHVQAAGVRLVALTVVTDDRCVVVGPEGRGLRAYFNRLVISSPRGVALEVAGTETSGMELFDNHVYNIGGSDPDLDHRNLRHNWKPFARAGRGIVVRGVYDGAGAPLRVHRNRISGYEVGLAIEAAQGPLNAWVAKNRIMANTTGLVIEADGCEIAQNEVLRSTGVGMVVTGADSLIHRNRIFDSARHALEVTGGRVHNNVLARNRGGIVARGEAQVVHNTFYDNGATAVRAEEGAVVAFANNLVDHSGTLFGGTGALERRHNVYANGRRPRQDEPGSRAGEVTYRDPAVDDFRPLPDSIAVDAAVAIAGIERDAANAGRRIGAAPDAGAYEVGPADARGRRWWVAPTGDDEAGDGTRERPFGTVGRAVREADPGDEVRLEAGGYQGDDTITGAGAEGHPIRILPAPGVARARDLVTRFEANEPLEMAEPETGKVTIAGGSWNLVDAPHLVIEGLEFRDSPHGVINLGDQSSHVTIRECVFINCPTHKPQGADWHAGITGYGPDANHVLIEGNIFDRRPNRDHVYRECDVINPFEGAYSRHWVIRNNRIAGYEKLQLGHGGRPDLSTLGSPPTYHLIEYNEFFECNRAVHIKSSDNIFRRNYIHNMVPGYTRKWMGMMDRSGSRNLYDGNTVIGAPYAGMFVLGRDNIVTNNLFVRCKVGVLVGMRTFGGSIAGAGRWSGRTHIYHNTFVDNVRAVQVDTKRDALVYNNIIYNSPEPGALPPTAPAVTGDGTGVFPIEELDWAVGGRSTSHAAGLLHAGYNLYWNAEPPYLRNYEGGGHQDVYADPLFVDAEGGDYRLREESPARRAGRAIALGHDKEGRPRPADAPDLGAFQCSGLQ